MAELELVLSPEVYHSLAEVIDGEGKSKNVQSALSLHIYD